MTPYDVLDERFRPLASGDTRLELLYDDCRWAEGPVYFPAGRYLLWSDIPNDRMLRWDETTGAIGVFRTPAHYPNGNTRDLLGRLVTCEQGERRITRTEPDGSITVLADRCAGKRFNSPNDLVVASDGAIWFTDPSYGIDSDYEGYRAESEIGGCHVYRLDEAGDVRVVADDFVRPNGLAFSPDGSRLYVADTRAEHLRVFDVGRDGTGIGGSRVFGDHPAHFDGLRVDERGHVWAAAGDEGVHCYHPDGTLIGRIVVPTEVANIGFGGPRGNRMFICAATSVYSVMLPVRGARGGRG